MTWPRGIPWSSSVDCAKPNRRSSKPSRVWRNCRNIPRQSLSKSPGPRAGSQLVPPRSITGKGWAVPGGNTWPICRASCIPGGLRTRSARHQRRFEEQLRAELQAIEALFETNGLPMKRDTLAKVQRQIGGISVLVDCWWQTVRQDLTQLAMTPRWAQWAEDLLLPRAYWHEQLRRTRHPEQKAQIACVLQAVEAAFERHPCTRKLKPEVLAGLERVGGGACPGVSAGVFGG